MVSVKRGDITKIAADVIVNAADCELKHNGGVARAIAQAAGQALIQESADQDFIPLGTFVPTTAGNLKAEIVIHIPTIDYQSENKIIEYDQLRSVWSDVLEYCEQEEFSSIATPLLGCGICGLDKKKVEALLTAEAKKFPDLTITIVVK